MQTSEQPNSPSIRSTWATGGTPASWQDRDASQNQRQLGLDGVTPPAAHCPRRLPPGLNQGGTSLVFFSFLFFSFSPKERVFELFLWLSALFRPLTPKICPLACRSLLFRLALPTSKEDQRISVPRSLLVVFCLTFPPSLTTCLHWCFYSVEDFWVLLFFYVVTMARMNRPAPVEITYKNMRFLITHNPTNATLNKFIEVSFSLIC